MSVCSLAYLKNHLAVAALSDVRAIRYVLCIVCRFRSDFILWNTAIVKCQLFGSLCCVVIIIISFVYLIDDKLHSQHQHPPRWAGHNRNYIQKG